MENYFLLACVTLGLAAACVAVYMVKLTKKAKDDERRRRTVQSLRIALEE